MGLPAIDLIAHISMIILSVLSDMIVPIATWTCTVPRNHYIANMIPAPIFSEIQCDEVPFLNRERKVEVV